MLFVLAALIIGLIFGIVAAAVVFIARRKITPAVGIVGGGAFLGGFIISLTQFWFGMPVWGTILLVGLLFLGFGVIILLRLFARSFGILGRSPERIAILIIGVLLLIAPTYFGISSAIYRGYDQAKYFDSILSFPQNPLPFNNVVTGEHLRVVDDDLATEIIQKSSPFGGNAMIQELHVGKLYGKLMWIGVMGSDAIKIGTDNAGRKRNSVFGFVGVDLTDPSKEVVVIQQNFDIGHYLVRQKMLQRIIWKINPNYIIGENCYFSMNDDGEMRLLAPYAISTSWHVEKTYDIALATYLEKLGGVLEFDSEGNLIKDYKDLSELPSYARIQCYPEEWLEYNINKWGRHRKGDHEFAYFFTTTEQLGISWWDDIRVIYDANTNETSQYVMLTQPESESQLLRGAIKANASGIFFFNWANLDPKPIDTLNALNNCATAIDVEVGTTTHNYYPILPLLYPFRVHYNNMSDYAYIVPIQFSNIRFGGVCITNPYDATGEDTIVEFANVGDTVDEVLARALNSYITLIIGDEPVEDNFTEILLIDALSSFEKDGNTIYVAFGNLTYIPEGETLPISENKTVWFTQENLNVTQWQLVLFLEVGDVLDLNIKKINGIFYCIEIISIS